MSRKNAGGTAMSSQSPYKPLLESRSRIFIFIMAFAGGIVVTTPRYHPIGTGMGADVREVLTQQITKILAPDLMLLPPLKRYQIPHMRPAHPLTKELRAMTSESRLTGLEASIGPHVSIEILWQTEKVSDMLFDRVLAF